MVSVGNLTMGGTGKTPMVKYIARLMQEKGYRPAIISRGYGGATKERINIVSDGSNVLLEASYVGDEPRMLAESLPGVMVLTGVVRRLPAEKAVELGADLLILDDGFQHLAIRRDLDLVLFNSDTLAGNSRVFPGGDLREPVNALKRCHGFVLTGINNHNKERALKFINVLHEKFRPTHCFINGNSLSGVARTRQGRTEENLTPEALSGERCYAFCGIARPEGFKQSLEELGIDLAGFLALPDHHIYKENEINGMVSRAKKSGASCLLCTEKDLVKLGHFSLPLPVYALCQEIIPDSSFEGFILDRLQVKK